MAATLPSEDTAEVVNATQPRRRVATTDCAFRLPKLTTDELDQLFEKAQAKKLR
jgi:hypothetical protein